MPLTRRKLAIPARPPSVRLARAWVRDVLTEIGRPDLVPSAELGVSELVTNAIIHAAPPVTVSVRGTVEHPRVEVADNTPGPLRATALAVADEADVPTTFGRGLALVAMHAAKWGSQTAVDGDHKLVWFEPSVEMREDADLSPIFEDAEDAGAIPPLEVPEDAMTVHLRNLPVRLYAEMRLYQFELRRELRLLSLSDPDRYPIASETLAAFNDAIMLQQPTAGFDRVDDVISAGDVTADLDFPVLPGVPDAMQRLITALKRCYDSFADEHLLATRPQPVLEQFQDWFYDEFVRQAAGELPRPWSGPLLLPEPHINAS